LLNKVFPIPLSPSSITPLATPKLGWDYVFEVARILGPSVLYIEDIDTFTPTDKTPTMSAFLTDLLDYLDGTEERGKVTILTSSNVPESIDNRLIDRPGRTDRRLKFNPKDKAFGYDWKKDVLGIHLKRFRLKDGLSPDTIAEMFRDTPYTGSHIRELIHTAMLEALEREGIEELKPEEINEKVYLKEDDFKKAVSRVEISNGNEVKAQPSHEDK